MSRSLTAEEAAEALGISVSSLYAYVSRGQIRSEAVPGSRRRRYDAADVQRLQSRRQLRRDPGRATREARHVDGLPVLESGLTLIADGRYRYRGHDATEWAQHATLEETAELLWGAPVPDDAPVATEPAWSDLVRDLAPLHTAARFQAYLSFAASADPSSYDLRPAGVRRSGARILRGLAAVAAHPAEDAPPCGDPVTDVLRRGWQDLDDSGDELVRAALVLCADHELNASAFTCRCVASAGASPYAAVTGALSALQGIKHGGHTELALAQLDEVLRGTAPRTLLGDALRQGKAASGFGHPLYPDGDPRARVLLDLVRKHRPYAPAWDAAQRTVEAGRDVLSEEPNLDLGLAVVARARDLPDHAPFSIFALGRTVGWIAHALEQYGSDRMIRPRASYVGPDPATAP